MRITRQGRAALDLNKPRDARAYVGKLISEGFPVLDAGQDYRLLSDEDALVIAERCFLDLQAPLLLSPVEEH